MFGEQEATVEPPLASSEIAGDELADAVRA